MFTHNFEIHQYYTRGRNNLFIPRATHEFASKYIRHNIIQIVNNAPNIILENFFTAYMVFPLTLKIILLGIINHAVLFLIVIFVNL